MMKHADFNIFSISRMNFDGVSIFYDLSQNKLTFILESFGAAAFLHISMELIL